MQTKSIPPELLKQILSPKFQNRFWSKIRKVDGGCWDWLASTNNKGYGQVNLGRSTGKLVMGLAHRIAWVSHHEKDVPSGFYLLHSCDNSRCCNPSHIRPGTQIDNIADMDSRGRRVNHPNFGEHHGMARFTNQEILTIRKKYGSGNVTYAKLAGEFKTCKTYIAKIVRREIWKTV